jgi:hypothetical protein
VDDVDDFNFDDPPTGKIYFPSLSFLLASHLSHAHVTEGPSLNLDLVKSPSKAIYSPHGSVMGHALSVREGKRLLDLKLGAAAPAAGRLAEDVAGSPSGSRSMLDTDGSVQGDFEWDEDISPPRAQQRPPAQHQEEEEEQDGGHDDEGSGDSWDRVDADDADDTATPTATATTTPKAPQPSMSATPLGPAVGTAVRAPQASAVAATPLGAVATPAPVKGGMLAGMAC